MKQWIDVPSGWQYGFPKLYDPQTNGDMASWIRAQGYPEEIAWVRGWNAEETTSEEK